MVRIKMSTVILVVFLSFYTALSQVKAVCSDHSHCSYATHCCKRSYSSYGFCLPSCVGYSCNSDSDCAPDECCDSVKDTCTLSDCHDVKILAGWIIAVIVIGTIILVVIPIAILVFCCCCDASRRPAHIGVIVAPLAATTVVPTNQGQPVPFQPYPCQPPPYEFQNTAYQSGAMEMTTPTVVNNNKICWTQ